MNTFRDPATMPTIIYGGGDLAKAWKDPNWAQNGLGINRNNRIQYHKGGSIWESDRFGPAIPLVAEVHRNIEEIQEATTPI